MSDRYKAANNSSASVKKAVGRDADIADVNAICVLIALKYAYIDDVTQQAPTANQFLHSIALQRGRQSSI